MVTVRVIMIWEVPDPFHSSVPVILAATNVRPSAVLFVKNAFIYTNRGDVQ